MAVCNCSYGIDVDKATVGVAECFDKHSFGVVANGTLEILQVGGIDKSGFHATGFEGVGEEVVATAVDVVGSHDVVAGSGDIFHSIGHSSSTAGKCESCYTAFESGDALLEHTLGGISEAAIDVAGITKPEAVGSVLRVVENIRCGLIYRHCARVGSRIGLFLTYVELESLEVKFIVAHILKFYALIINNSLQSSYLRIFTLQNYYIQKIYAIDCINFRKYSCMVATLSK